MIPLMQEFHPGDRCTYRGRECVVLTVTLHGWSHQLLRLLVLGTEEVLSGILAEDCEPVSEPVTAGIRLVVDNTIGARR